MDAFDSDYFPKDTFSHDNPELDAFIQQWYGKHLQSMDEPRLYPLTADSTDTYRFLCLPTFDSPFALRVQVTSAGATLTARLTNGQGGYETGELLIDERIDLTVKQLAAFNDAVQHAGFWSLDSVIDDGGLDGTHFVVEGVAENRYHVVDRWCPEKSAFRKLCDHFVALCPRRIRAQMETAT